MGLLDKLLANKDQVKAKASDLVHQHGAKIDDGLEKAGDSLSRATKGKYDHQIRKGVGAAKQGLSKLDEHGHPTTGPAGTTPGASAGPTGTDPIGGVGGIGGTTTGGLGDPAGGGLGGTGGLGRDGQGDDDSGDADVQDRPDGGPRL